MAKKTVGRTKRQGGKPKEVVLVKATLRLTEETAKRLTCFAAMTGKSQSDIAEEVLKAHLARFRIQTNVYDGPTSATDHNEGAEDAA